MHCASQKAGKRNFLHLTGVLRISRREFINLEDEMNKRIALALILIFCLLSGCAAKSESTPAVSFANQTGQELTSKSSMDAGIAANAPAAAPEMPATAAGAAPSTDRVVLKTASLSIIVDDPVKAMDAVVKMAAQMNGWVVNSNLYKVSTSAGEEVPAASISIRVPADSLDAAMTQIKALVKDPQQDISSENVSGQDVTSEYTDLQSRLTNLQAAEAQLKEIMASATKTEDVMAVFNQLTEIRSQIEVLKGQIKYYDESSSFSSISVAIVSSATIQPLTVAGWQPQGVARDALQALVNVLKGIVNVLIWVIIVGVPTLIILYFIVKFIIWVFRKLFPKKKKVTIEQPMASPPSQPDTK
jgi:uncharacterized lipoprotein YehR (DUF1307 family)